MIPTMLSATEIEWLALRRFQVKSGVNEERVDQPRSVLDVLEPVLHHRDQFINAPDQQVAQTAFDLRPRLLDRVQIRLSGPGTRSGL